MKKEFLMLAQVLDPAKHYLGGAFISQKLDGVRAIWDGGLSRGRMASEVPYANTYKDKKPQKATGLWSRTGKVIAAPDWFLDKLPKFPLDGELWMGYHSFQQLTSCVNSETPDDRWRLVEYKIFDSPSWSALFAQRVVKVRNDYSFMVQSPPWAFNMSQGVKDHWTFELVQKYLRQKLGDDQVTLLEQTKLPPAGFMTAVDKFTKRVLEQGGEGSIIRYGHSIWTPERSWNLLKYKPLQDAEGVVTGYYSGKETDKGSKLLGMMGALELNWQGAEFKISGFTDAERTLISHEEREWCRQNPGERMPNTFRGPPGFPKGSSVTFQYRELSDDGVPKEARYLRKENAESDN